MAKAVLTIYYDGRCHICQEQRSRFDRLDAGRGILRQVDFRHPDFDPAGLGVTMDALASSLHARTPRGDILRGMAAIRAAYSAVGKGWITAPTGWPILRPLCDGLYHQLARHRYRLGGRCDGGSCATPPSSETDLP